MKNFMMQLSKLSFSGDDIGIDLGTASVLIYKRGAGIVLHEPSVVAIDTNTGKVIAVGEEAREMLGRTPGNIQASRPLREGVIADYETTERMLSQFLSKAVGKRHFWKPRIIVCIPTGATDVEERAVRQATLAAGAKAAYIVEEPLAAALGAGMNIEGPQGNMIVDIGGGTTDVAVLSLGGIVCDTSLRIGGDKFDQAIIRYVRSQYNLMIGERTAEEIKKHVGSAYITEQNRYLAMEVKGRHLISGLPRTVEITAEETNDAMREPIMAIVEAVKKVLEITPPELAADIINNGLLMTGGGALLEGFDLLLQDELEIPVYVAENAVACVALGTGRILGHMSLLEKTKARGARRVL